MLTLLATPAINERGPRYMEKALAAIHQGYQDDVPFTLIYGVIAAEIGLLLRCQDNTESRVLGAIGASYPHCSLTTIAETDRPAGWRKWSISLDLVPELFPILRHAQFEDQINRNFADPVSVLLRAIKPDDQIHCQIEISCVPASHERCHSARRAIRLLDREFFRKHHRLADYFARHAARRRRWHFAWWLARVARGTPHPNHSSLDVSTSRLHEREEDLQAAADKLGGHLFDVSIRLTVETLPENSRQALDRLREMQGAFGAFTRSRLAMFQAGAMSGDKDKQFAPPQFLMSHEELATLWHPPTSTVFAERLRTNDFVELEPPVAFHTGGTPGDLNVGRIRFRDDRRTIALGLEDRRRHVYIVGKTGMGKTTLLQNMIASDSVTGSGLCLIDPHGDLAESILGLIPSQRTNDVIYFDAGSRDCSVAFNPLLCSSPDRIDLVTSGVVSAFKKLHDSWGPRLEDTLRNAVFAIVEQRGTLLSVMRLLGEKPFREQIVPHIEDEIVRSFWIYEFASWNDHYRTEAVAAIQNKIRPFLTNRNIRGIISQSNQSLDLREIMDDGKLLIVNLSKGRLGEDNSTLLGAFLVTSLQQAAMTRADMPEESRRDFSLYVDEFQNFTTGSFASVLSEARKYRLSLVVAHQYLAQLDEQTSDAVWGNVGSVIAFQVGSADAEILAQQLGRYPGQITTESLTGLPKFTAYSRLLIDGLPSNPMSLEMLPPRYAVDPERAEVVRRVSRRRYGSGR